MAPTVNFGAVQTTAYGRTLGKMSLGIRPLLFAYMIHLHHQKNTLGETLQGWKEDIYVRSNVRRYYWQ